MDTFRGDYRDNPLKWSLGLGRISGIRVRVHLLFFLWVLFQLVQGAREDSLGVSAVLVMFFFGVVLLHEFGHCFGARAVGGDADDILMWPLGGLATVTAPMTPRAQFITTAAGPMVNLVFCVATGLVLVVVAGSARALPLNPFAGPLVSSLSVLEWRWTDWLVVFFFVNYIILLFNLLPTFPMDGGRLLQAILWKKIGYHQATMIATFVGMVGAILFGLCGLITEQMILVCIAVFGYLTCMQHRQLLKAGMLQAEDDWHFGTAGAHEASEQKPSWIKRWRQRRLSKKIERERQRQEALDTRIDEILEKVHHDGMHSLSAKQKKLLEAETERKKYL